MGKRKDDIPVFDRGRQTDWIIPDTGIEDGVYVDIPEPEIPDGFREVIVGDDGYDVEERR